MWLVDKTAAKSAETIAPPVVVSGLTLWGISLQDWVYILTSVYLIVMIIKTITQTIIKWRDKDDD